MARLDKVIDCEACPYSQSEELCNSNKCPQEANFEVQTLPSTKEKAVVWTEDLDLIILRKEEIARLANALGLKVTT
jgi:hypothetical protein